MASRPHNFRPHSEALRVMNAAADSPNDFSTEEIAIKTKVKPGTVRYVINRYLVNTGRLFGWSGEGRPPGEFRYKWHSEKARIEVQEDLQDGRLSMPKRREQTPVPMTKEREAQRPLGEKAIDFSTSLPPQLGSRDIHTLEYEVDAVRSKANQTVNSVLRDTASSLERNQESSANYKKALPPESSADLTEKEKEPIGDGKKNKLKYTESSAGIDRPRTRFPRGN